MPRRVPRQRRLTRMYVSLVLAVLSLTSTYVQAQEGLFKLKPGSGIQLGPLVVHPGFRAEVIYDDNIFLRADRRVSDLITRLTPLLRTLSCCLSRPSLGVSG